MKKVKRQNKVVTGIAVTCAVIILLGGLAFAGRALIGLFSGPKEKNLLKIDSDTLKVCSVCGVDCTFTQEEDNVIRFSSDSTVGNSAHSQIQVLDKAKDVSVSAVIGLGHSSTKAGFSFGYEHVNAKTICKGMSVVLDYNADTQLLRVVSYYDHLGCEVADVNIAHKLPINSGVYTNSYPLSYFGVKDLSSIKLTVTKTAWETENEDGTVTTGVTFEVKVGNKKVDFIISCDENGNCRFEDNITGGVRFSSAEAGVYLVAVGSDATFTDVELLSKSV